MSKIKAFKTIHEANAGNLTIKFMRHKSKVKRCNVKFPTIILKKMISNKEISMLINKLQSGLPSTYTDHILLFARPGDS